MERYDPDSPVDAEEWVALDEGERQYLVERYHLKKRIKMPNSRLHAAIHVIVENQLALGSEIPTQTVLARLMREGLSRHDAVHAIGSVLARHLFNLLKDGATGQDVKAEYYRKLEALTAEGWRNSFKNESEEE
jgi:hypothetical protein